MSGTSRSSRVQPTGVDELTMASWRSGARTESATQASSSQKACDSR